MLDNKNDRLEKLLRNNKIRQAKSQLIADLSKHRNIDISNEDFVEFDISEEVYKKVYERIKREDVKILSFPFDEELLKENLNFIFDYFKKYDKETIFFYPSTFGFYVKNTNQLYHDYPISINLQLEDSKRIIMKLMLEMHDDLLVISQNLKFGFVLSEDEYLTVRIEYWDANEIEI
jgi:hypothetical protein